MSMKCDVQATALCWKSENSFNNIAFTVVAAAADF